MATQEFPLEHGWISAGKPTEEVLRAKVEEGYRIFSLLARTEEAFDEECVVQELGGSFRRFPTTRPDFGSSEFRRELHAAMNAELQAGGKVYFHCASANRTGAAWATFVHETKNTPLEEALQQGERGGLKAMKPDVVQILSSVA